MIYQEQHKKLHNSPHLGTEISSNYHCRKGGGREGEGREGGGREGREGGREGGFVSGQV